MFFFDPFFSRSRQNLPASKSLAFLPHVHPSFFAVLVSSHRSRLSVALMAVVHAALISSFAAAPVAADPNQVLPIQVLPVQSLSKPQLSGPPVSGKMDTKNRPLDFVASRPLASAPSGKIDGKSIASPVGGPLLDGPLQLTICVANGPASSAKPTSRINPNQINTGQTRFDFGAFSSLSQAQLSHTFFLRNDNKVPVTVAQLQTSSGCLQVAFAGPQSSGTPKALSLSQKPVLHQLLPPGQQMPVHITLNSTVLAPGALDQSLWVFIEGQAMPAATLKVTGNLQPLLQFSPRVLDFGHVSAADLGTPDKHSLTLIMTLDAQLAAGGLQPRIVCSNADIKVDLMATSGAGSSTAAGTARAGNSSISPELSTPLLPSRPVVRTYQVRVSSNTPPGALKSRLIFSFAASPQTKASVSRPQTASSQGVLSQTALPSVASPNEVLVIIPVTGTVTK